MNNHVIAREQVAVISGVVVPVSAIRTWDFR
jgi:hypothetical protein